MEAKLMVILTLVATAIAGPISIQESDKCSTECTTSNKFSYESGNTYTYEYSVDTVTSMSGASEDMAKLKLEVTADFEALSPCEFALSLRNTQLFHSDGSGAVQPADRAREHQLRKGLAINILRFSFQDGRVDNVCADPKDEVWALNIKKGILSAFQNSMDDLTNAQNVTETDVTGTCRAEYQVVSNGYYTTSVKKTKDVFTCTKRHNFKTILQVIPYKVPSDMQSIPIMKTTHECEQEIEKGGVLKTSTCTESHVFRPFSNGQSGGQTTVKQSLTYQTSTRGVRTRPSAVTTRDSLIYDHSVNKMSSQQARLGVEKSLREICETTSYDIRPESPRLFSDLVASMRSMDKQDMEDIFKLLKTKSMCPTNPKAYKFFLDALPMTSTSASVSLMTSVITSGGVHDAEAKAWIISLAFIQAPTSEMLLEAKSLVDNEKYRDTAMLHVTSMVNNYCKKMTSCGQDYAVLSIIASLERNIGYSCDASGQNFHKILLSLRALGNAGHASRAVSVINKCLTSQTNALEIRVAAANAFRRMPCDVEEEDLWNTYRNADLDSELRIAAYLALMRCPSDKTLGKIAASLEKEEDDQVGAFVYSHLTNLRETSDPHKQEVARAINNLALGKEFDLSPLKFSRNYEASALLNKINTGFVAESNLIWSNNAQLPRSISGNLTVDLFGDAINLVDFGGRLEGLEYLIKNLFGPYMPAGDEKEQKNRIEADDVQGSFYGRAFGNEMFFLHSKETKSPFANMPSSWLDMVIQLSQRHDYALTHSGQVMDVSAIIPTSAGLPINIDVNVTAVVDLKISGKADLRKLGSSPRSLDVDGEIRPSGAIEVTGTMSVDAVITKTGLRMRNTMHTSTAMKGRIQLERGQQLNVELDTPQEKMEIFDARSKFFILYNDMEKEQDMITKNRKEFKVCSGSKVATITGMELCGEISFPNASMEADSPYFPLTGPVSGSLTMYKKDAHTGYKLFAKRTENKKASMAQISFNTPGSKTNRAILMDMSLNYPKQEIEATMATPWKKAAVRGVLMNNDNMKSLSGNLIIDDTDTYAITSEVKISKNKNKMQLSPMFEVRRPGADNIQLTGFISMEKPLKSVDVDLSLSGVGDLPYSVKSSLSNTKKEKSVTASFSQDGKKEYSLLASHQMSVMGKKSMIANMKNLLKINTPERQIVSMDTSADYREDKSFKMDGSVDIYRLLKRPANFKVALLKNAKKRGVRYDADVILKSTALSGRIDTYMFLKNSGLISTKTMLDYTIPKVAKNKVILSGKFNDRSTKAYNKYTLKSNLNVKKNPEYNMGLSVDLDHKAKHSEAEVELKYGPNPKDKNKRIYLSTALDKKIANYKNAVVSYKMQAEAPAHKIDVSLNGKHIHKPKMLDSNVKLSYGKGKDITAGVLVKDQSSKLKKLNGKMNVAWPGSEYALTTQLAQKSAKQYSHTVDLKSKDGMKHTISTIYKMPKARTHEFSTDFKLNGLKPVTVSGSTTLDSKDFEASGEIKSGKDVYGLSTRTKLSKSPSAKVVVELIHPQRRMTLEVDGGKNKNKYDGHLEAAWDADKDKSQKIVLDGSCHLKSNAKSTSLGGNLAFSSPFENYENLLTAFKYGSDKAQHDLSGKLSWGKGKQIVSSLNVKKPISLSNLVMTVDTKTPFKGFRVASAEINHNADKTLNTIVKGKWEKESAKLSIQGEDNSDSYNRNIKGNIALKSTMKNARDVTVTVSHNHDSRRLTSSASLNHNGDSYAYDLNMDHSGNGWQIKNNGDLMLTMPKTKISTNWKHRNSDSDVKSTLTSEWGNNRLYLDLTGSHELSSLRNINGVLKVQSPWRSLKDVVISVNHKNGYGLINSNAALTTDGRTEASSTIKYTRGQGNVNFNFGLTSPYNEDFNGNLNTQYGSYPFTTSAEFSWSPRKKVTAEGSVNVQSWDNADIDVKLTTPVNGFRNALLKVSNKREGEEIVSHLNLDYGVRKNIDLESRLACTEQKQMARVKLTTPFEEFKSLDTGFRFEGNSANFDSSADFVLEPIVGKFQGTGTWQYNGDLSGKLRIDTPIRDYPYFQLSTSSKGKGRGRQSRIEAESYPRQVYSLDTTYTLEMPISFEATINSPYPEYDNLGVSLQHNHSPSSVLSNGELRFQPQKKIEYNLNADWSSNVDGNLVVNTPIEGYENNKISLRHQGDMENFASHGEVNIARKSLVADASFKSGWTTSGTFTLSSPIPGMENIEFTMKNKGKSNNFKGGATLTINGDKIDADFNHKLSSDALKSGLKLSSPYTEDLKLSIDHDGLPTSFTNKMSFNYGNGYDIDTTASFNYRNSDVNGNGMIKYKLGNGRNTAAVSFNKAGLLEDMTFTGTASYNRDDVTVNGSWKSLSGLEGSVQIQTPFDDFKSIGMTMSHYGDITSFRSSGNINYMDNKNINGKIEMSADGLRRVRFSSEVTTPFVDFPSASVTFNNDYDEYRKSLNGNAVLTTPVGGFGTSDVTYSKTGSLENLAVEAKMNMNGRELTNFKLTNSFLPQEVHSKVDLKAATYPTISMRLDHMGDLSNFNTKTFGMLGRDSVSSEVTKRGTMDDMNFSGMARYNRDTINVNGSWKNREGIDGSIEIKTPFDDFRNIGMTVSHTGDISQFTSSADIQYMDNMKISGKAQVSIDGFNRIRITSDLKTPFRNFESTNINLNNIFNGQRMEVNGNADITTTFNRFGTASLKYSISGQLDNLVVEGSLAKNRDEVASIKVTNTMQDREIHGVFNYKCINVPEVMLTFDHTGDMNSFNTKAQGSVGNNNIVSGEATLNQRGNIIDTEGKIIYNIQSIGSNQGSVSIHKEGEMNDFEVKTTGKYDNQEVIVTGAFKVKDEITGSLTINTPIRQFNNVGMSFKHSGNLERFNSEGQVNLADGEQYSGKIDFYRYLYRRIEITSELKTPLPGNEYTKFEYRHEGEDDKFKCYSTLEYGNSQKITYDMRASMLPNPDFSVTLKTPIENYEELLASVNVENSWPKYGLTGKVNAGNGRIVTVNGAFDTSNDVSGSLDLVTPVEGFSDIGMSFHHSGNPARFDSEGRVTYMDGQDISGKISFKLRRPYASVELKTPFSGFEFTKYEYRQSSNNAETTTSTTLIYGNGDKISTDTVITYMPNPGFSVTLRTPFNAYEEMMASGSFENSWPKYVLSGKVNAGNGQMYTMNGVFDASNDISGSLDIETPVSGFTNIGASFLHAGNDQKFNTEGKLTYMDGQDVKAKVNFYRYMWRRVVASAELNTPFNGFENTKVEANFEDNSNSMSATAALEYGDDQKLNGNMKLTYSPNYDVLITLNTPFYNYRVVRAQGSLDVTAPSYGMSYSVNYGSNQAYSVNGKLNLYSLNNLDGSVEITVPISGFEYTKAEYKHKINEQRIDGSTSVTYGNGQVISGEVKSTIYPNFDGTVIVKTPFRGYKNMRGSATFDSSYNKYDISSSLKLGGGNSFSMTSGLDYSTEPLRASTKITTPFSDFRNMELVITHEGSIDNFECTGFFNSPLTDAVNAKASMKYTSLYEMSASTSLKTALTGMDDLKAELKNSDVAGQKKTHAVIGWTQGQEVVFDGMLHQQEGWYENKVHADVSLSTPFVAVRNIAMQMDHSGKQQALTEKLSFELNGAKLLDVDGEYNSQYKHEGSVTFRQPWAMQYTVSASTESGVTDADIVANWNRDEVDSNVHVIATVSDKSDDYQTDRSFDIGLEHASRKVGVVHKYSNTASKTVSDGKVYWDSDDSSKISYNLELNDHSRRNKEMVDGTFKLGLPSRTLALTGSFSDRNVAKAADATFSWDADRDESKQVGVKATMTRGDSIKGDMTLSMPAIRKEIRVNGEVMMENGRVIFDGKTDISYSPDARKTLTLTSKIEDISDYYSNYNYSLELGVSHPDTNVDIHMTSHLGSSDERMTMGMKADYLTARRTNKNIALLAEINNLKKQINLQFTNPMNKIEIVGDVVSTSPYKVRMLNKIDDVEVFRSDVTMDSSKKSLVFNAFMDSDRLTVSALYPNSSAFHADITRHTPAYEETEALLGLRLNTSRLLHTRVHWCPHVMDEIRQFVIEKAMKRGYQAKEVMTTLNDAVAEELAYKYAAISSAFVEEVRPLVDLLEQEMAMVAIKMNEMSRELRSMYSRNDFYIQNMGDEATAYYMQLQETLNQLTQNYRESYTEIIRSMSDNLKEMSSFPIRQHYSEFVGGSVAWLNENLQSSLSCLEEYMANVDEALRQYKVNVISMKKAAVDTLYNATYVDYIANQIGQMKNIDISPYVTSFQLPEEYTNAINRAHNSINSRVNDLLEMPEIKYVSGSVNEVYQQGVWAYNYWQLEENIYNHARSILNLMKEIVEDELKEYYQNVQALYKNPITVWDPKNGEVQADFILPIDVERLDEMPDLSPLAEKAEKMAAYLPDYSTLENAMESMADLWPVQTQEEDAMTKELKKFNPSKKLRKLKKGKGRRYRVKQYKQ